MGNKLYIGNLSYQVTESELEQAFAAYGTVKSCKLITDRDTGRSKGFAFVEMENEEQAQECINNLEGHDLQGRSIRVSIARERTDKRFNS